MSAEEDGKGGNVSVDVEADATADAAGPRIAWEGGGAATLAKLDGERIELVSTRAFAPGSRPKGHLEAAPPGKSTPLWMKVHGSRRQDDGFFRVSGRLLNATREQRAALEEAIQKSPNRC